MNCEFVKQLKEANFPFDWYLHREPNLSQLIEACGDRFKSLTLLNENDYGVPKNIGKWIVEDKMEKINFQGGKTPEEAVKNLWLELNKK